MIRVNGELLNPELIEETFSSLKADAEQRSQASCCGRDEEWMRLAEDEVIDSLLLAQEAEKAALAISEEDIADSLAELIKRYRAEGASWEMLAEQKDQLRSECIANLRMERYLASVMPAPKTATEQELRNYYQSRSREYRPPVEVHCLHLIKIIDEHEDQRELLDEMSALRARLLAGEDFRALASAETEKTSKEVDLGWIPLDRPINPFETILFSLSEGEISPVISYEHALHLIQVIGRRGGQVPSFEEIREELSLRYHREERQSHLRQIAKELRSDATIEQVDFSGGDSSLGL